jgi:anti-sigma factor RsiW
MRAGEHGQILADELFEKGLCPEEGVLVAYANGELMEEEALRVAVHLESCGECREFVEVLGTN